MIVLQDESKTMVNRDHKRLRRQITQLLGQYLYLSNPENRLGVVTFGTVAKPYGPVGAKDFSKVYDLARKGFPTSLGKVYDYRTIGTSDPAQFTDIALAIGKALDLLSGKAEGVAETPAEKGYVILFTDGRLDPYPGDERRFGEEAIKFLRQIRRVPPSAVSGEIRKIDASGEYRKRLAPIDEKVIMEEMIPKFQAKKWEIHSIGFGPAVNEEGGTFLEVLRDRSHGTYQQVSNPEQLAEAVRQYYFVLQNLTIKGKFNFCKEGESYSFSYPSEAAGLLLDFDFGGKSVKRDKIRIVVRGPDGRQYVYPDDETAGFSEYVDPEGVYLSQLSLFPSSPAGGKWAVEMKGVGGACGTLLVSAKEDRAAFVELDPDPGEEGYVSGRPIQVRAYINGPGKVPISLEGATLTLFTPNGPYSQLRDSRMDIKAETVAQTPLLIPDGIEGNYWVEVILQDRNGSRTRGVRAFKVRPACDDPQECIVRVEPSEIDLGVLGAVRGQAKWNAAKTVAIESDSSRKVAVELRLLNIRGEKTGVVAPLTWFDIVPPSRLELVPQSHQVSATVQVNLKRTALPVELQDVNEEKFRGELEVTSDLVAAQKIPVKFTVAMCKLKVEPEDLTFGFWFRLGAPVRKGLRVESNCPFDQSVIVTLPQYLRSTVDEESIQQRIWVDFEALPSICKGQAQGAMPEKGSSAEQDRTSPQVECTLAKRDKLAIPIIATVDDPRIDEDLRIPPEDYSGEVEVAASPFARRDVHLMVTIPHRPLIYAFRRLFLPITLVLSIVLLSVGMSVSRSHSDLRKGSKIERRFTRDDPKDLRIDASGTASIRLKGARGSGFRICKDESRGWMIEADEQSLVAIDEIPVAGTKELAEGSEIRVETSDGVFDFLVRAIDEDRARAEDTIVLIVRNSPYRHVNALIVFGTLGSIAGVIGLALTWGMK